MKIYACLLALFFLLSCSNDQQKKNDNDIDYKKAKYGFFLGQTLESVESKIDLQIDYNMSNNLLIGPENFMCITEDQLDANDNFPALFFKFSKNKLARFSCSVIGSDAQQDISAFVKKLEPLFGSLSVENQRILSEKYLLNLSKAGYTEQFMLDTMGRKYDVLFRYVKELE